MSLELLKKQAQEFSDKGYSFTVVPEGEKKSGASWSTKPATIEDIKSERDNLGLLHGSHSSGLICVDLDTDDDDLRALADEILPKTDMMDGRGDYLKSHRFYVISPEYQWHDSLLPGKSSKIGEAIRKGDIQPFFGKQPFKISPEAGSDGIDFLGVSGLVACPPTLHKSGARREWSGGAMGEPSKVSFDLLYNKVLQLARAWNCITVDDRREKKEVAKERDQVGKVERVKRYLSEVDPAIDGQGGNKKTFGLMCKLAGGLDLSELEAMEGFEDWNARCLPPWESQELSRMYRSAYATYGEKYGSMLSRDYKSKINVDDFTSKLPHDKEAALSEIRINARELAKLSKADLGLIKDFAKENLAIAKGLVDDIVKESKESLGLEYSKEQEEDGCLNGDDFLEVAQAFIERVKRRFVRYAANFYVYESGLYSLIQDDYMEKKIHDFLKTVKVKNPDGPPLSFDITKRKVAEVFACVKNEVMIRENLQFEDWLDGSERKVINLKNGLYDMESKSIIPHSDNFFSIRQLEFDFDSEAHCPAWMSCLQEWFNDDESRKSLGALFSYIVSGRIDQQKVFLMIGKTRAGKGTAAKVLEAMVGSENTCGPQLSSLSRDFGLEPLLGKSLALVGEANVGSKDDSTAITNIIKMITGDDKMTINRKNQKSVDVRLKSRFVFMANHIEEFPDISGAISGRFIILPFRNSFFGKENKDLDQKLKDERSGIFNWMVQFLGVDAFEPKSALIERAILQNSAAPVKSFFHENYELIGGQFFHKQTLYSHFKIWADDNDIYGYTENRFFKEFKGAFGLSSVRRGKTKESFYDGMRALVEQNNGVLA